MNRFRFVIRRLLQTIPLLIGITILVFALLHITPGDPARAVAGFKAPPEAVEKVRKDLGLDRSLPEQYWSYLSRTLQGDLGESIQTKQSVASVIERRLPVTLWLIVSGLLIALAIAIPCGALAAFRRDRMADHMIRGGTLVGLAMPIYWVGIMLLVLIALPTGLFPVGGFGSSFTERLHTVALPAIALAIAVSPVLVRSLRSSITTVLESDYVMAARAIGLRGTGLFTHHILRNAAPPMVALIAIQIGYLLFGAVVLENAFSLPGLGQAMVVAAGARDFPMVLGITLVFALIVVLVHLVADVVIAVLDPRVQI